MLSIGALVRRVRAYGGQFLLLAMLTLVAALLMSGVPRIVNDNQQQGLRAHLGVVPPQQRDVTYLSGQVVAAANGTSPVAAYQSELATLEAGMPPVVRRLVEQRWFAGETRASRVKGPDLAAKNLLVELGLRTVTGIQEAGELVEGRWPADAPKDDPVQVALAVGVAGKLNLRLGSRLALAPPEPLTPDSPPPTRVTVVGLFEPRDDADGFWDGLPPLLRVVEPLGDGQPFTAVGVVDAAAVNRQAAAGRPLTFSWRYRMGADGIDARELDQVIGGLQQMTREAGGRNVTQGLDIPLRAFAAEVASARTVLGVIAAGVLATLTGLVVLAAGLLARRRRAEFALLRARGASSAASAGRSLAEALLVVPPAAVLGWLVGNLAPGAPGETGWFAVAAAVLVTVALPVATLAAATGGTGRRDLVRSRPSARRLTVEAGLLLLAGLAVVLLRRRGLTPGEVDPLLVSVPVLLAVAAAVAAMRLYPWPLRLLGRLAARGRGSVAFLGTARAGRSVVAVPLVVVVLAIATAAFCAVTAAGIEASRDRAASRTVPADALILGERIAPDTGAELERLPGVRAASPVLSDAGQRLAKDAVGTDTRLGGVTVLIVDGPALARMLRQTGVDVPVPTALLAPAGGAGPLPAVVSPTVAAELADAGLDGSAFVTAQGQRYEFRVAGRAESFPMLDARSNRFVVLPWQSLPGRNQAAVPTGFLVAGDGLDPEALRRVGDAGQARFRTGGTVVGRERTGGVQVLTFAETRRQVGEGGANGVLAFGFVAGAAGGTALGLLAVAFTVLAGARERGQVLSRLRTLGLARRQWRGLLLVELAPLVGVSVVTGALVGTALPLLLTPVLGLSAFTDGVEVRVAFEPALAAGVVALGALALGFAIAVEALNNRRMRLGEVLRLGEES